MYEQSLQLCVSGMPGYISRMPPCFRSGTVYGGSLIEVVTYIPGRCLLIKYDALMGGGVAPPRWLSGMSHSLDLDHFVNLYS